MAASEWRPSDALKILHYDRVAEDTAADRRSHDLRVQRDINGIGVSELLRRAARVARRTDPLALRVADLAAGRGGSVPKFLALAKDMDVRLEYLGADVDEHQIREARRRQYTAPRRPGVRTLSAPSVEWLVADCFGPDSAHKFLAAAKGVKADLVSCQMALHYSMRDEGCFGHAADALAALCADGGACAFTTVDAGAALAWALEEDDDSAERGAAETTCSIRLHSLPNQPFGASYDFRLGTDAGVRVNDAEFLVHRETVCEAMHARGFRLLFWDPITKLVDESGETPKDIVHETLQRDWEICSLYVAALFVKDLS